MKNIIMKRYIISHILLFLFVFSYSQSVPPINENLKIESPSISQFMRYDDIPVSEYTGVPDISVPFYQITVDGVKLPITISYHASGIKVNQESGWVGLGWDIPIGSITQIINDYDDLSFEYPANYKRILPDYRKTGGYTAGYAMMKYPCSVIDDYGCTNDYNISVDPIEERFSYQIAFSNYIPYQGKLGQYSELFNENSPTDSEPDIFKANILGETINFIIDFNSEGNKFIVLNKKGYSISYEKNTYTWIVINPEGIKFYFTNYTESKGWSGVDTGKYKMLGSRSWVLNKIETTNGNFIEIIYKKSSQKIKVENKSQVYGCTFKSDYVDWHLGPRSISAEIAGEAISNGLSNITTTLEDYELYIDNIIFPKGKLLFNTSEREDLTNSFKLNAIKLVAGADTLKTIDFNYSYFIETSDTTKRLKLTDISINKIENYSFKYDETILPVKNSLSQDYWGYYNGYDNKSLIPNPKRFNKDIVNINGVDYKVEDTLVINNNMSANLIYAQAGTLKEITYPTGGRAEFEYELNEFNNYIVPDFDKTSVTGQSKSKGQGLRVKSITHKEQNGKTLLKTQYTYWGGKAMLTIKNMMRLFIRNVWGSSTPTQYYRFYYYNITSSGFQSSNPLASFNGVGYEKVVKEQVDPNNQSNNGKTVTEYNVNVDKIALQNEDFANVQSLLVLPTFKERKYPANGTPKKVFMYDNTDKLFKVISFNYTNIKSDTHYGVRIKRYVNSIYIRERISPQHLVGFYPIVDFESLLTEKNEKEYIGQDSIEVNYRYIYKENNLLDQEIITGKKDFQTNRTVLYKYPQDFKTELIYKDMYNKNMLSQIIRKTTLKYNGNSINSIKTNFTNTVSVTNGFILPSSIETSSGGDPRVDLTYDQYDAKGNILQYTTSDGVSTTYLWSYNYQYPIAEIKNAKYNDVIKHLTITPDSLSSTNIPDMNQVNALRDKLPNALVTTYTYKPLVGIETITDPRGFVTTYEYDDFGRLKWIKDNNKNLIEEYKYHYREENK